ncbi:MAG: hypothetical protein WA738_08275 [Candidatus Angelobacter sp.]
MELIERYLQAVRFWLPKAQQQDITAELRDDIQSRIEDKESALGRRVNEDEIVAILQQSGHPMRTAARYQPQESLIGPALFPLYKFVVKIIALGYLAPWALVWFAMMLFMPSYRAQHLGVAMLGTWASFWSIAFTLFGIITLVFVVLERFQSRLGYLQKWDPRKLPRVAQRKDRVSRVESVFGLVFSIIFVVWWLGLPRYGHWMFAPVTGNVVLNPALRVYFLPALVPTLVLMVQQCINLFRPQWTWLRAAAMLAADGISLAIVLSVLKVFPYIVLAEGAKNADHYTQALLIVNQVVRWSFIGAAVGICIALVVHAFQTVQAVRQVVRRPHDPAAMQMSQML